MIFGIRTMRFILVGVSTLLFTVAGVGYWLAVYHDRYSGFTEKEAAGRGRWGAGAVAGIIGTLYGGRVTDKRLRRQPGRPDHPGVQRHPDLRRRTSRSPSPCRSSRCALRLQFIGVLSIASAFPGLRASMMDVTPVQARGVSSSAFALTSTLFGTALAPPFVGLLSDLTGSLVAAFYLVMPPVIIGSLDPAAGPRTRSWRMRRPSSPRWRPRRPPTPKATRTTGPASLSRGGVAGRPWSAVASSFASGAAAPDHVSSEKLARTLRVRTYSPKASEITRKWYVVDAEDLVLGRLATEVARILRGKHKPIFAPHMDMGDHVIVINAEKVVLTAEQGRAEARLPPLRLPGRPQDPHLRRRPGAQARGIACAEPSAGCSRRTASAPDAHQAQGVRRPEPPPLGAAARGPRHRRRPAHRLGEPVSQPLVQSTGRRKQAIARVRVRRQRRRG